MPIDSGLFAQFAARPKSMGEYRQDLDTQAANALALKAGTLQYQNALQAQQDDAALREVAKGFGADTTANYNALLQRGLVPQATKYQADALKARESQADISKKNAETTKTGIEAAKAKLDFGQQVLTQATSPQQLLQFMVQGVQKGTFTKEEAQSFVGDMPTDLNQFAAWQQKQAMQGIELSKRLELQLRQQAEARQSANELLVPDPNNPGKFMVNEPLVGAKSRIAQSGASTISLGSPVPVTDPDNPNRTILVQPPNRPGGAAQIVTIPGSGKPVEPAKDPKDKALTEGQAKANLFGTRMSEADRIINELESQGTTAPSFLQQMTGGSGVMGRAATATASPQQQQVDQAQRDFINAVLRRESGASISPAEFDNARLQYFVQPGDSKEVIAQKKRNRLTATEGMLSEVPEGKRGVPSLKNTNKTPQPTGALTPEEQAELEQLRARFGKK